MVDYSERITRLYGKLEPCTLCPRMCRANRLSGIKGKCRTGVEISVSSHNIHFGEEPPISGFNGSGAIFFTNCNLSCVFCQNYPISQLGNGNVVTTKELAFIMLQLQERKAHNINLVTPTHVTPQITEAVQIARNMGLTIPLVYNSNGYESVDTLRLLEGVIDIYMPDAKYSGACHSEKYSSAPDYWEINKLALKEMYRQAGNLAVNGDGIAVKGLLIRHLVLPNNIAGSREVLEFIAKELSQDVYLSLMAQYHPAHISDNYPELSRRITPVEYRHAMKTAQSLGLENGWQQEI